MSNLHQAVKGRKHHRLTLNWLAPPRGPDVLPQPPGTSSARWCGEENFGYKFWWSAISDRAQLRQQQVRELAAVAQMFAQLLLTPAHRLQPRRVVQAVKLRAAESVQTLGTLCATQA